jgi:LCP family protein required for cell wall assembly
MSQTVPPIALGSGYFDPAASGRPRFGGLKLRRIALTVTLVLLLVACSGDVATTTTVAPTTSTTTTTIPTTTTTLLPVEGEGVDPDLIALVRALYSLPAAEASMAAPATVIEGFRAAQDAADPTLATAHIGVIADGLRVAVVEAGEDITLAVCDPDCRVVGGWWPSHDVSAELGEFPRTVAVVGSDARPDEDRETTRSDSIHFVTLDGEGSVAVVGLPRDSWVTLPGRGNTKVNAALNLGGPDLMMETFAELTGAEFDGYLLTGFAGFQGMVDVLGGLEIDVPRALNDRSAKASLEAGLQILDASDALAFTRVRKALPDGDFGRQANGGLALIAAAGMLEALGATSIPDLMERSWDMYSTDMSAEELLTLAAAITTVKPEQVSNVVAAGSPGMAGAASVVFLADGAYETFEDMLDGRIDP